MNGTKALVVQTVVVLAAIVGSAMVFYGNFRADLSKALDETARHEIAIAKLSQDNEKFAGEIRGTLNELRGLLSDVRRSSDIRAAVSEALAAKKK